MSFKKRLVLSALLLSVAATPAVAIAAVDVVVNVAPPAPRVEVVPAPRTGYVWAPGHWAWRKGTHVWVNGHWVAARKGYNWVPAHWVERPNGRWAFVDGHWAR